MLCSPSRLAAVLALTLVAPAAAVEWSAIPLRVSEPAGVARRDEPVTVGVPLPPGALRPGEPTHVEADDGTPVPAATRPLERWPDGSVRWLLLDLLATAKPWGQTTYRVRRGPAPAPARALRVERVESGWDVDTGALQLHVPADGALLARDLRLVGAPLAEGVPLPALTRADGIPAPTRRTATTVEHDGPIRTEFLLTGTYGSGLDFELRLAVFAGSGVLRLQHTLIDRTGDPPYVPIRSLALRVPVTVTRARLGVEGAGETATAPPRRLRQASPRTFQLDDELHDGRGEGWVDARTAAGHVTLVSRYFWEEYPQAAAAAADGLTLALVAASDEPILLGRGAAKTHELWLAVSPATPDPRPEALAARLRQPLLASPPADWTTGTGASHMTIAPGNPVTDRFLARLGEGLTSYRSRARAERWDDGEGIPCGSRGEPRIRTGFYGTLNWGDWNFPGLRDETKGCDAWGNLEYDLPLTLGLGWLATGDPHFLEGFVASARHYRDVDIIHYAPVHPDRVGLNHPHKVRHFAPDAPASVDLGHAWLQGLLLHYRLTGEARSLAAARAMGDALVRRLGKASNPRHFGWPMIALAALVETDGGERYREAARGYAEHAMAAFPPTPVGVDWKIGILADGIASVHAAAGGKALRDWLMRYADALLEHAADPALADPRYALPLAYVAGLTAEARYREQALATARRLEVGGWGKELAADGRVGFRLLGALAGVAAPRPTPAPGAPPPA